MFALLTIHLMTLFCWCLVTITTRFKIWLLFLSFFLGHHYTLQVGAVDHSSVDFELPESVINLSAAELLTPGHERVTEPRTRLNVLLSLIKLEQFQVFFSNLVIKGKTSNIVVEFFTLTPQLKCGKYEMINLFAFQGVGSWLADRGREPKSPASGKLHCILLIDHHFDQFEGNHI